MNKDDKKIAKRAKDAIRKKRKRRKAFLQSQVNHNRALENPQVYFWLGTAENGGWIKATKLTCFFDVQDLGVGKKIGPIFLNAEILQVNGEL